MHQNPRDFVFAYGSLIDPASRAISAPTLGKQGALPITVNHLERVWSARTKSGWTAMGVRFRLGAYVNGILLEVDQDELVYLDEREANYLRVQVHLDHVELMELDGDGGGDEKAGAISNAKDEQSGLVKMWVYVQKETIPSDHSHPIPQSYVDVILRGCLKISRDFARSFIETTDGWHGEDEELEANYVNDRNLPLYIRADDTILETHGEEIDELLEEHQVSGGRAEYDLSSHLVALEVATQVDKASPLALERVLRRLESTRSMEPVSSGEEST